MWQIYCGEYSRKLDGLSIKGCVLGHVLTFSCICITWQNRKHGNYAVLKQVVKISKGPRCLTLFSYTAGQQMAHQGVV